MDSLNEIAILPGAAALFAGSTVLSLIVSLVGTYLIVKVFRARVAQSMAATAGDAADSDVLANSGPAPAEALTIDVFDANRERNAKACATSPVVKARHKAWTTAAIFAAAACWYPSLMSVALIDGLDLIQPDSSLLAGTLISLIIFLVNATPVALAPMLATGARMRNLAFACLGLVGLLWAWDQRFGGAVDLWLIVASIPTGVYLLLSAVGHRVIGPIVSAATTIVIFGHLAGVVYAVYYVWDSLGAVYFLHPDLRNLPFIDAASRLLSLPPADRTQILSGLITDFDGVLYIENKFKLFSVPGLTSAGILLGATMTSVMLAWALLRWLARSYRDRQASDQILTVDVLMLVFTIFTVAMTAEGLEWGPLAALAAFVAYKITCSICFRFHWSSRLKDPPRTLLLLRVFGFDKRTRTLLQDIGHRWRYIGPIRLIAGTDLVNATIEPHEFFSFMHGRLSRDFVKDLEDVRTRLSTSSAVADPDGLYRIEDYFCHTDTWRTTVSVLAQAADAVLMDLRGFTARHQGCIFELECLIASAPLDRVVLLIDHTTDVGAVENVLQQAWAAMPENSPNRRSDVPRVRILRTSSDRRQMRDSLLDLLSEKLFPSPISAPVAVAPSSA